MTRRRRHVEMPPRRIEAPVHAHTETCQLTTFENGEVVTYRGVRAVSDWLKRVGDLARERGGYVRSAESSTVRAVEGSAVRVPAHLRAPVSPVEPPAESEPSALTTQEHAMTPPVASTPDRLGF